MLEKRLRKFLQPFFNTLGRVLIFFGLTPNMITGIAFAFGVFAGAAIAYDCRFLALGLLWVSGLCDVLDGTVARLSAKSHPVGAYHDLIADRMVESVLILGFAFSYPGALFAYLLFMVSVLLHFSTFVTAGALFKNTGPKSMHYDHSVVERAEAFVVFSAMLLFPAYLFWILLGFTLLIFGSALSRYRRICLYAKRY